MGSGKSVQARRADMRLLPKRAFQNDAIRAGVRIEARNRGVPFGRIFDELLEVLFQSGRRSWKNLDEIELAGFKREHVSDLRVGHSSEFGGLVSAHCAVFVFFHKGQHAIRRKFVEKRTAINGN